MFDKLNIVSFRCCRKEIWIMDPAADIYYKWLTIIAGPVFYNLIMIVTRYLSRQFAIKQRPDLVGCLECSSSLFQSLF